MGRPNLTANSFIPAI